MASATTKPRWSGIIGTGQSLGAGVQAELDRTTDPAPGGLQLLDAKHEYDTKYPTSESLKLVSLVEPMRDRDGIPNGPYPWNLDGMTPHSAMAAQIFAMSVEKLQESHMTVHTCVNEPGRAMDAIEKNGLSKAYASSMYEAQAVTRLAHEQGQEISYDAIVLTHGETDAVMKTSDYGDSLVKLLENYSKDLMSITGQIPRPIMIVSQQNTSPFAGNEMSKVIQDQWNVSGSIVCSGPKYQYGYAPGNLHFPIGGYNRLGEKYGQVFYETFVEKHRFVPLSPASAYRRDAITVVASFHVPYPPLAWDDHIPRPHQVANKVWSAGRGFELLNDGKEQVAIESVAIEPDGKSIAIKVKDGPGSERLTLNYAMTSDLDASMNGFYGGCAEGRIGQLCDSDPLVGAFTETLRCEMTNGSAEFTSLVGLERRALYDILDFEDAVIVEIAPARATKAVMSKVWTGKSGEHDLVFRHNQRNYLVSFHGQVVEERTQGCAVS